MSPRVPDELAPLWLASASPRRRDILTRHGYAFEVRPADVDETPPEGLAPARIAEALALRKAVAIRDAVAGGTVIGADTLVVGEGDVLHGKPEDDEDARRILRALSGTTHRVLTGVALVHADGRTAVGHEETRVTMRPMSDAEIAAYVASGESKGKAGAYAIQEKADRFVARLEGDYENVVGFPPARFAALLVDLAAAPARGAR